MIESMFKVGDTVRIRKDLKEGTIDLSGDSRYNASDESVVSEMIPYRGKLAIIMGISPNNGEYYLDIDDGLWSWTHHMFEEDNEEHMSQELKDRTDALSSLANSFDKPIVWGISPIEKPSRVEQLDKLVDVVVDRLKDMTDEIDIRLDRMIVDMAFAKDIKELTDDEKEVLISKVIMRVSDTLDTRIYKSRSKIILNFMNITV